MAEVPVRELNQNTAGVLARVKQGEQIDITERGVSWHASSPRTVSLVALGEYRQAAPGHSRWPDATAYRPHPHGSGGR